VGFDEMIGRSLLVLGVIPALALGLAPGAARAGSAKATGPEKIGPELLALHEAYRAAQRRGAPLRSDSPLLRLVDDRVLIDAAASGDVRALEADLVGLGMRHAAVFGRLVSGELPIVAIPALGALHSLAFARASASARSPGGAPRGP
jgi:hypothetical protein